MQCQSFSDNHANHGFNPQYRLPVCCFAWLHRFYSVAAPRTQTPRTSGGGEPGGGGGAEGKGVIRGVIGSVSGDSVASASTSGTTPCGRITPSSGSTVKIGTCTRFGKACPRHIVVSSLSRNSSTKSMFSESNSCPTAVRDSRRLRSAHATQHETTPT